MDELITMNISDITCLLFDLDDTLYPQDNGIWEMIGNRINQFLVEQMHFSPDDVPSLRHQLWEKYGTTLRGLQEEFSVDTAAYLDFVHDIPLETVLSPNAELDLLLTRIPQRKVIFTNACAKHALGVIDILGIRHHFDAIIDVYIMTPYCKPQYEAYQKALDFLAISPENCVLIDDSPRNLETAQAFGMGTISVGIHHHDSSPHINSIKDLLSVL
jgi:putative hydrolase of the HAD superfamily